VTCARPDRRKIAAGHLLSASWALIAIGLVIYVIGGDQDASRAVFTVFAGSIALSVPAALLSVLAGIAKRRHGGG
jgi:hypothetical protein